MISDTNIVLYEILGINDIDTLYFSNDEDRDNYFNSLSSVSYEINTWYPPFYENVIKLDDVKFTSNYNYCSIKFNGKNYYYFIDKPRYINEDVIQISLRLDTIMTFMNSAYFNSYVLERKLINRWTDSNKINRLYIREQLSNGVFINNRDNYIKYFDTLKDGWFVVHSTETSNAVDPLNKKSYEGFSIINENDELIYSDSGSLSVFPLDYNKYTYIEGNTTSSGLPNYEHFIIGFDALNEIYGAYFCPFFPFNSSDYRIRERDNITDYIFNSTYWDNNVIGGYDSNNSGAVSLIGPLIPYISGEGKSVRYKLNDKIIEYNFYYEKNTNKKVSFNTKFIPYLLDENYLNYSFGESDCNTSFPLYTLIEPKLYCFYGFDFSSGNRIYRLTNRHDTYDKYWDYYSTGINSNVPAEAQLYNDAWNNYKARNKATFLSAIGTDVINALKIGIGEPASRSLTTTTIAGLKEFQGRNRKGQFTKRKIHKWNETTTTQRESQGDFDNRNLLDLGSATLNYGINAINLTYTPNTKKNNTDVGTGLNLHKYDVWSKLDKVNDYEKVGRYIQRFGYKVDEYNETRIECRDFLSTNNKRYYFNYYKFEYVDVTIRYNLVGEEVEEDFRDRLYNGVRFWNIANDIVVGDYTYDNVEKEYIVNE